MLLEGSFSPWDRSQMVEALRFCWDEHPSLKLILEQVAASDPSPWVRTAARDVLFR